MSNFVVYGLPRSRTAWLSEFLTYKDHSCLHEAAITLRSLEEFKEYFSRGNTGVSETGIAQGWWLVNHACPSIKTVVVKRPISEVVSSLMELDLSGIASYDKDSLTKHIQYGDRMLDKISSRPGVLTVSFSDLKNMSTCKDVFEHCLPYDFDIKHWSRLKNKNIQINMRDLLKYYYEHSTEINEFKKLCKMELRSLRKSEPDNPLWKAY